MNGFGFGYGFVDPGYPVEVDLGDDLGRKPSVRRKKSDGPNVLRKGSLPTPSLTPVPPPSFGPGPPSRHPSPGSLYHQPPPEPEAEPEFDPRRQSEWFRQRGSEYPDRGSWDEARALYTCQVVHECAPPPGTEYRGMPFFTLRAGKHFAVLAEAGHPSTHKELPLYIDDGEDCLLLVRDETSKVGWALASFLLPLS